MLSQPITLTLKFGKITLAKGNKIMPCVICKIGNTKSGLVTVTLQREDCIVILKKVPAEICENCGEYYLSENITEKILQQAEKAVNNGAEVEIIKYAVA
jgi:YgiT-type zinc finger domain-containing protein